MRRVIGVVLACGVWVACGQEPAGEDDMAVVEEMGAEETGGVDMAPDAPEDQGVSCVAGDMQIVREGEKICELEFYRQCLSGVLIGTTERCAPPPEVNIFVDIKSVTSKPFAGFDNVVYADMIVENRGTMIATGVTCSFKGISEDGTVVFQDAFFLLNDRLDPGQQLTDPTYRDMQPNNPRKKAKAELTCTSTNEQSPWSEANNYDSFEFEW